jgi:hypothetical protein
MKKALLLLTAIFLTVGLHAQVTCPPFVFDFTIIDPSCPNSNDGSADAIVSGGTAPYTYLWSANANAQTTSLASDLTPGIYSVIVADDAGCIDTGYVTVIPMATARPDICMVTVDGGSINNIIYWDKTVYTNVDSFVVYREVSPTVYKRIGAVSNDSLSQFIDTSRSVGPANGDPNIASYRYKLQIRDLCGNYGLLSRFHNTIYIEDAGAGQFAWSIPYMIENGPNPVNNYILLCDTANIDFWTPVRTVAGTQSSATDPGFANHSSIANWRVKTGWGIVCDPTRATVNTSRSNIKHAITAVGIEQIEKLSHSVLIYPNPAADLVSISLSPDINSATIHILNMIGQELITEVVSSGTLKQIDISGYSKGVYTVLIESGDCRIYKKLLVH